MHHIDRNADTKSNAIRDVLEDAPDATTGHIIQMVKKNSGYKVSGSLVRKVKSDWGKKGGAWW